MDGLKGTLDSFHVEEAYNWRDDIMEITRRIVHETDEARLNNIAEHFETDLSEIREFLEMKREKMQKSTTNADRIRAMTEEELAKLFGQIENGARNDDQLGSDGWLDWLRQEVSE